MAISKKALEYHERMFPGYVSDFLRTDPEFIERFDNFSFDEVVNEEGQQLDDKTRFICILAVLIGSSSVDEFRGMAKAALNFDVTPVEIKEIVYQAVDYLGIGRVFPFLKIANEVLESLGYTLPLEGQAQKYYTYAIAPIGVNATNPESDPLTSDDIGSTSKVKIFRLTNTFSPKTLQLTKIMNDFVDHQANVSAVIVFELTGYQTLEDNTDKQIYHKVVGMKYDKDTDATQTLPVKNIPHTVTKLKVKEISGTNVTPAEGTSEQWATLDGDTFKVTFENNYNNTNFGGGVVNRYKANKDATGYDKPEQDGKIKQ